jgi:hypothetical protein
MVGKAGSIASTAIACVDIMAAASATNSPKRMARAPLEGAELKERAAFSGCRAEPRPQAQRLWLWLAQRVRLTQRAWLMQRVRRLPASRRASQRSL